MYYDWGGSINKKNNIFFRYHDLRFNVFYQYHSLTIGCKTHLRVWNGLCARIMTWHLPATDPFLQQPDNNCSLKSRYRSWNTSHTIHTCDKWQLLSTSSSVIFFHYVWFVCPELTTIYHFWRTRCTENSRCIHLQRCCYSCCVGLQEVTFG